MLPRHEIYIGRFSLKPRLLWFLDLVTFHDVLQVGKGLVKDAKAQKLAFQHWIEAVRLFLESFSCRKNGSFVDLVYVMRTD